MLRRRALAALTGTVCAIALALPASASAGTYTVAQCHPANPSAGEATRERSRIYDWLDQCSIGGPLSVTHGSATGTANGDFGAWVWRAPAGTVFNSIEATAQLSLQNGDQGELVATAPGGMERVFASASGVHRLNGEFVKFRSQLECTLVSCVTTGSIATVSDVLLRTEDRSEPSTFLGGSLFAGEAVRGRRNADFRISDQGGGVSEVELTVNAEPVYADRLPCQVSGGLATALRPCPGTVNRRVPLSTGGARFATGVNRIEACGADLALDGVANETCAARSVFVDDICPSSSVGAGSELNAFFKKGKERIHVRSNERATIKGTLGPGAGVGGATVCVLTRTELGGQPYEIAGVTTTDDEGRFKLRLPRGPSRDLFVHRVSGDQVLARHGLSLSSKVRPSLEITPRTKKRLVEAGERLRFKGELPGPACNGRVVKVQAKIGKDRWQVFRTVGTNDGCRYKTRFKLRATERRTRYAFRVRVPEQAAYPYKAGASSVRVRQAGPKKRGG